MSPGPETPPGIPDNENQKEPNANISIMRQLRKDGDTVGQSCISKPINALVTYIINVTLSICTEATGGMGRTWTGSIILSFPATA